MNDVKLVKLMEAKVGDAIDPSTIPEPILKKGGGWVGNRYVVRGCHRNGYMGWMLLEIN